MQYGIVCRAFGVFMAGLVLSIAGETSAQQVIVTVETPVSDVAVSDYKGFEQIALPDPVYSQEVGAPMVPVRLIKVIIPPDAKFDSIRVETVSSHALPGHFFLYPAQPPRPLSQPKGGFVWPDEEIYTSSSAYPGRLAEYSDQGGFSGYKLVSLDVYPVQYIPAFGEVVVHEEIALSVFYSRGRTEPSTYRRSERTQRLYRELVEDLVLNPEDVEAFSPPEELFAYGGEFPTEQGFEYVVITPETAGLARGFQEVVEWKTKKGVPAVVRTTEWIDDHYPGDDTQEKIRNYLKVAHQDSGLVWVMLGGDKDAIPIRDVWFWDPDSDDNPENDTIPADLYYSCLDGDWDFDDDHVFGEKEDSVDYLPEVFVGRALVTTGTAVRNCLWRKIEAYEKYRDPMSGEPLNHATRILFLLGEGFEGDDGYEHAHTIDTLYIPARLEPAYLVESWGNLSKWSAIDSLNAGFNIVLHTGHGHYCTLCLQGRQSCTRELDCEDFDALRNAPHYTGMFSTLACDPAGFDHDRCMARSFFQNTHGGGFFIGNTRYGWEGTETFERQLYRHVFDGRHSNLGCALAWAKAHCAVGPGSEQNTFRWTQYSWTLIGDPETPIWTYDPLSLSVTHPETLAVGSDVPCEIRVEFQGIPLQGVSLCLWADGQYYNTKETDWDGVATFNVTTAHPGEMSVVATLKSGGIPYEGCIDLTPLTGAVEQAADTRIPNRVLLSQNIPNPFSASTTISFGLPQSARVSLEVYDVLGRRVRSLLERSVKEAGYHRVLWNGQDNRGEKLPSGVYFVRLVTEKEERTRRITLVR